MIFKKGTVLSLVIFFSVSLTPVYAGDCSLNAPSIRQETKAEVPLTLLERIYYYFFPKTSQEPAPLTHEKTANTETLHELDQQLARLDQMKTDLARSTKEVANLRKQITQINQHPLIKLSEFQSCTLRYQKAYDTSEFYRRNGGGEHTATNLEDESFSHRARKTRFSVQELPGYAYDPEVEARKHSRAYKAANCLLASGEKTAKTVLGDSKLSEDAKVEYANAISYARMEYHQQHYFDYSSRMRSVSSRLLDVNRGKFNALVAQRTQLSQLLLSVQKFRDELTLQYDKQMDDIHSKLDTAVETIATLKEKFGQEIGTRCIATLSQFCSLRASTVSPTCQTISSWQQRVPASTTRALNSGQKFVE